MSAVHKKDERDRVVREAYLDLAAAADEFEQYTHPHAVRIAAIADRIAESFHLASQDRKSIRTAARIHDLGEVAMEREYIQRAGTLSDEEKIDLHRHPVIGEQEAARAGADRDVQLLVRWHHEWWNGGGYPDGLRQNEIPLAARILRVADSYASLTDARPYREALTEEEARKQIANLAGIEFDPAVATALLGLSDVDELRSHATSKNPFAIEEESRAKDDSTLFSSFLK